MPRTPDVPWCGLCGRDHYGSCSAPPRPPEPCAAARTHQPSLLSDQDFDALAAAVEDLANVLEESRRIPDRISVAIARLRAVLKEIR